MGQVKESALHYGASASVSFAPWGKISGKAFAPWGKTEN